MFLSLGVYSQSIKGVTEEGKKVILNNDGTWQYEVIETKNTVSIDLSDCKYWKDEVDDFTGKVKKYTKSKYVGKSSKSYGRLTMELRRFDDSYLLVCSHSSDLGCVSSNSYLMIKLLNGEVLKLMNIGDIDCSDMNVFVRLPETELNQLLKSPIEQIRIQGTEYYDDVDKIELPNYIIDNFKCIKK
jgi:hypothetical protein